MSTLKRQICVVLLLALAVPLGALGASDDDRAASRPDAATMTQHAQRWLAQAAPDENGPGIAVLVARGDKVLFRGARGRASVELDVPLSPDHVFRIGSVTKQFAAAGLLRLIDEGKVALDDPLSKFLPDYPNGDAITIAQLLNHTSGIRSYTSIPGHMDQEIRRDLTTAELIDVFKDEPVDFAPGEGWSYNNSGYVLVGAVIEKASGMPWFRWLDRTLFEPLALSHTQVGAGRGVVPNLASGYSLAGETVSTAAFLSMTQPHAAGALLSTVDDLWRWNRALHQGKVLSPESYRRMTTPEGKAATAGDGYGYGIQVGTVRGRTAYGHGGGIFGFLSHLTYVPGDDISVVVLRNADGEGGEQVGVLARRLAALALGDPYPSATPVDVPQAQLEAIEGVYRLDEHTARTLRVRNGKLTSQRSGGAVYDLVAIGEDTFVFADSLSYLRVERGDDGAITGVRFFAEGEGDGELWRRTDETSAERRQVELPRAMLERFVGNFVAPQVSFRVFFDDDGVLRVQVPGQSAFALKAQSPTLLFITEVDATFEFAPADGPAQTATLRQGPATIVATRQAD
jgi:D-alanyl-D-alanine carboxypeptidase